MKKRWIMICMIILLLGVLILAVANLTVIRATENLTFDDLSLIPKNRVALLLGTAKYTSNNLLNLYFIYRINAASELYKADKIEYVLISGDNSRKDYNEPQDMKDELVKKGIPADRIYLDYAGFRTYDSIVRAKEVFGLTAFTVVSQKFHNQRAIYIANKMGIEVFGYNAKDVYAQNSLRIKLRELIAKTYVFVDLLINSKPKFLGEKIAI